MKNTNYEVKLYEVHSCNINNEIVPALIISEVVDGSCYVLPLYVDDGGYDGYETCLVFNGYVVDVSEITTVSVDNMCGYHFTIPNSQFINQIKETIAKYILKTEVKENDSLIEVNTNKYEIWEVNDNDNTVNIMILNDRKLNDIVVIAFVDDEKTEESSVMFTDHNNCKKYINISSMITIASNFLFRRLTTVVDVDIRKRIDDLIMSIFFKSNEDKFTDVETTETITEDLVSEEVCEVETTETITEDLVSEEVCEVEATEEVVADSLVFTNATEEASEEETVDVEAEAENVEPVTTEDSREEVVLDTSEEDIDFTTPFHKETKVEVKSKRKGKKPLQRPANFVWIYNRAKSGEKVDKLARELGVCTSTLKKWIKQYELENAAYLN